MANESPTDIHVSVTSIHATIATSGDTTVINLAETHVCADCRSVAENDPGALPDDLSTIASRLPPAAA